LTARRAAVAHLSVVPAVSTTLGASAEHFGTGHFRPAPQYPFPDYSKFPCRGKRGTCYFCDSVDS